MAVITKVIMAVRLASVCLRSFTGHHPVCSLRLRVSGPFQTLAKHSYGSRSYPESDNEEESKDHLTEDTLPPVPELPTVMEGDSGT